MCICLSILGKRDTMNAPTISRPKLATQADAVIYFFTKMDDEMIDDLLIGDRQYQEMPKTTFVRKLSMLFDTFEELGDLHLMRANRVDGEFNGKDVTAITYIGNNSHNFVDILFEKDKNGYITDMYEFEDPESDRDFGFQEGRLFIDNFELYDEDGYEDAGFDEDEDFDDDEDFDVPF